MAEATWRGIILAESDQTIVVEGYHYFPPDSVDMRYLQKAKTRTTCPWKGEASYYDVVIDGQVNQDAAWSYPEPKPKASHIKGYVAFWKGVEVR
jgi:uncharacterized protein (DUF427 family)